VLLQPPISGFPAEKLCFEAGTVYMMKSEPSGGTIVTDQTTETRTTVAEGVDPLSALLLSGSQQDDLLQNVSDAVIVTDTEFRVRFWNRAAEVIYGWTADEALTKPMHVVTPTTLVGSSLDEVLSIVKEHGEWRGEVVQLRRDGVERRILAALSRLRSNGGEPIGAVAINRDVTDLQLAMAESKRSRLEWESIFQAIKNPAVILDPSQQIIDANKAALDSTGLSLEQLRGKPCWVIFHGSGSTCPPQDCPMVTMARTGYVEAAEMEVQTLGGTFIVSCTPILDEAGQLDKVIHIVTDVTARRRLEDQLRQAQKMESVGQLAGGVAHDFNNILMPILSYAEMLLDDLPPTDPRREDVARILSAAERAKTLTRQLLAFSRKQVIELKPLDLNEVLKDFGAILRRTIREDISITVQPAPAPAVFEGDATQLEQVLMNLAVNGQDAMQTGGELRFQVSVEHLEEGALQQLPNAVPGSYAVLTVSDTGCGMDEATLGKIFEPFYTTKPRDRGTGLGLATVYGIVKQHRGLIGVTSEPGQGTTFTICLPTIDAAPRRGRTPSTPTSSDGRGTVLVVEDDALTRTVATRLVKKLGYTTLEAESGPSALKLAAVHNGPIHLLLTDVVMPAMDGKDLYDQLLKTRPRLKVLYMSGYASDVIVDRGVRDEGALLIQKPFTRDDLAEKLRSALAH